MLLVTCLRNSVSYAMNADTKCRLAYAVRWVLRVFQEAPGWVALSERGCVQDAWSPDVQVCSVHACIANASRKRGEAERDLQHAVVACRPSVACSTASCAFRTEPLRKTAPRQHNYAISRCTSLRPERCDQCVRHGAPEQDRYPAHVLLPSS